MVLGWSSGWGCKVLAFAGLESGPLGVGYMQITVPCRPVVVALGGLGHLAVLVEVVDLVDMAAVVVVAVVGPFLLTFRHSRRAYAFRRAVSTFPQQRNR